MKGGQSQVIRDGEQVCDGEWRLTFRWDASISFGSCQHSVDKSGFAVLTDIGEIGFELVAYAGEVGVNRLRIDVIALKGGVITEGLRGGFDW